MFNLLKKLLQDLKNPTEDDYRKARQLADEQKANLPKEFTLSGKIYPDMHFIADKEIPGLYRAKVFLKKDYLRNPKNFY